MDTLSYTACFSTFYHGSTLSLSTICKKIQKNNGRIWNNKTFRADSKQLRVRWWMGTRIYLEWPNGQLYIGFPKINIVIK